MNNDFIVKEGEQMPFIRCDVTECAYNDENGECIADLIQVDYDGCLTFEEGESEDKE